MKILGYGEDALTLWAIKFMRYRLAHTKALSVNNFALRACHLRTKLKSCFRTTPKEYEG
jgi:hypothetical protein